MRIRLPSDRPNTTTNRSDETTGATTVWLHSRVTRSASRAASQKRLSYDCAPKLRDRHRSGHATSTWSAVAPIAFTYTSSSDVAS